MAQSPRGTNDSQKLLGTGNPGPKQTASMQKDGRVATASLGADIIRSKDPFGLSLS